MNKKLDYVDALRGIAILGVMLVHTGGQFGLIGTFSKIAGLGAKGVQLFYFISAFTLFLSYNNRKYQEQFPISNFYIRRFFRIAPLYYLAMIYYIIKLYLDEGIKTSLKEILLNFTFTHGFSPVYINHLVPGGWSIAVEMCFYVMVPLLMSKINNINKAVLFIFVSLLIRFIFLQYFELYPVSSNLDINNNYMYWYLPNQLPCFAIGILFYFIVAENITPKIKAMKNNSLGIIIVALLASLLCVIDQVFIGWNFFSWDLMFCLVFFVLAIVLSLNKMSFLVSKFATICGKYSYSMYITHFIVLFWIKKMDSKFHIVPNKTMFIFFSYYIIVVLVTILLSKMTYKIIELPTQLIGKNIINKKEKKQSLLINSI